MPDQTVSIDLLSTVPSSAPFMERVRRLKLSRELQDKVLNHKQPAENPGHSVSDFPALSRRDEKELAAEMLLHRHRFTETVYRSVSFRQAALTVIQNIYLFQKRTIFLDSSASTPEQERQEALLLFSRPVKERSAPIYLAKTFQHSILARIWNRINSRPAENLSSRQEYIDLLSIIEQLNTLRNIYMILCQGLVRKLVTQINTIYRQSVTFEDAIQIGEIGIARAAYRFSTSTGIRFSTFASNWVFKEIQRQALSGRLIRISANTVERYAKATRENSSDLLKVKTELAGKTAIHQPHDFESILQGQSSKPFSPTEKTLEKKQLREILIHHIDHHLSEKSGDILKRQYGLPPYLNREQSVIEISKTYGVTRGAIYQQKRNALKKLATCLDKSLF
jgi:RNA polymerase sigma factor (sigma-70 family)